MDLENALDAIEFLGCFTGASSESALMLSWTQLPYIDMLALVDELIAS